MTIAKKITHLPDPDWFWARVHRGNPDECWEWIPRGRNGKYGVCMIGEEQFPAHRIALSLAQGILLPDEIACHTCDNPPCCNPSHLYVGTTKSNAKDREDRGRRDRISETRLKRLRRGEEHPNAKLTEQHVQEIRRVYTGRYGELTRLAQQYNVHVDTIKKCVRHTYWAHVKG